VIGEYLGVNQYYPKVKLGIWTFSKSISAWGPRLILAQEFLKEFYFIKNDNENSIIKMPIQRLKVWVHELATVILMFKDPKKKQVVGLVFPIDRINNEISLINIEKSFRFK
jgi:hypothetical protein